MTPLPVISGPECIRAQEGVGFVVVRQKGSHITLRRATASSRVTVPDHRELDRGTLRSIIRQAELTGEDFVELL